MPKLHQLKIEYIMDAADIKGGTFHMLVDVDPEHLKYPDEFNAYYADPIRDQLNRVANKT